ncbi:alpha/beta hydrolase [Sphingomonas nostoxanthinifaciens]|uniref:alpha/beta hydrolase n=1 Tax=Sphingomonas nostoxanthinifaciens TaxID=2872652 RepID=UPI001CC1C8F2|nr:alpha/beta hydrolase [Sphingomonas nostoxanthinifaciens]UAK22870.1 alpha/beta hydrolase [Sphingomonas nostoxanthinifaciens]
MASQPPDERRAIAAMGRQLGPDMLAAVYALYRGEQDRLAADQPVTAADVAYGDDPRQKLDVYARVEGSAPAPVLLWVHGGGFLRGEKASENHPFNAHVGRWAARNGMVGAVMNYRLAPDNQWPAGGEDVNGAIDWLRAQASDHGGDPARIVLAGTSAGSTHIATALRLRPDPAGVRGAILLSGLYGFTPLDERDTLYYGPASDYPTRRPLAAMVDTALPLLLACAEYDPPRFQEELVSLLAARLARHGTLPATRILSGHNHFSLAYHIGGRDTRLAEAMLAFIADVASDHPKEPLP